MKVSSDISGSGIRISIGKEFRIAYPDNAWKNLKVGTKESLRDNILYSRISPISIVDDEEIIFDSGMPVLKPFFDRCIEKDLPRFGYEDNIKASILRKNLLNARLRFSGEKNILPEEDGSLDDGGVIGLSFGKDSLLSYAVMKELGLKPELVFFNDLDDDDVELIHKKKLMKGFEKKFNEKIMTVQDDFDGIPNHVLKKEFHGIYGCNAMNSYMLMSLPFAYGSKVNQVVFGNEQNFNDSFTDPEGNRCFVSYEQSSEWMVQQNRMLDLFTGKKIRLVSYVEPLYNLAEIKVLFKRYPEIACFQMSCSHGSHEDKDNRWCQECPMCAKAFLYLAANGINPKVVGFTKNLFDRKYWKAYPLFNPSPDRIYEKPAPVREEQLLAFYLAYKNGFKGELIDEFKEKHIEEAKEREELLRKKFLGFHEPATINGKILSELKSIYKEELSR